VKLLAVLKFVLVLGLCAAGVYFLLKGLGVATPFIKYKGAEAHDIPAGVALLVAAIAVARLWTIRVSQTVVTQTTTKQPDGTTKTTRKDSRSDIRFMPSGPK